MTKLLTYDKQIQNTQKIVWELADQINVEQLKNSDRIFHSGLVFEESEMLLKMFKDNSIELKQDYLILLNEAKKFYKKMVKHQSI